VFRWLSNLFAAKPTQSLSRRAVRMLRARYDAAATTDDNRRHWANADGLSANAANSAEVRRILRNRARYEVANNSYARGIVLTLANDVIGTGPRLQMLTPDAEANRRIEQEFARWAKAVNLAEKLRTMQMAGLGPRAFRFFLKDSSGGWIPAWDGPTTWLAGQYGQRMDSAQRFF
jgi:hypothetical protein